MSNSGGASPFSRMLSQIDAKQISVLPPADEPVLTENELAVLARDLVDWLKGDYALELDRFVIQPKFDAFVKRIRKTPVPVELRLLDAPSEEPSPAPDWPKNYNEALSGLASCIVKLVKRVAELEQRLAALDGEKVMEPLAARLAEVEARMLTDEDVWCEGVEYRKNALVTYGGNLWRSKQGKNSSQPGAGDGAWRLMQKTKARQ